MNKFEIIFTNEFLRKFKQIKKKDKRTAKKISNIIRILGQNPFSQKLKTHRAIIRGYGTKFSSRVTGDIRIGWDFVNNKTTIACLTIGGHDDVYN